MELFKQDIIYTLRTLWKNKFVSVTAILILALGIGANTVIFSAVNTILLHPLPYSNASRIVYLWETVLANGIEKMPLSLPEVREYREQNQVFDGIGAYSDGTFNLVVNGEPEQVTGTRVSTNMMSLLGANPIVGRDFRPEEETPGRHRVAILSHGLWMRRFNGDPNVVNHPIALFGIPYTIVGVMPADFSFPTRETELWAPLVLGPGADDRDNRFLRAIGRVKSGIPIEQAQASIQTIASRLEMQYPQNHGVGAFLVPVQKQVLGDIRKPLQVLFGAVALVLLIVCANVASLLLAKAVNRQKEIALRIALGANRQRLIRQFLTESLVLALLGGAAGLIFAFWGLNVLLAISPKGIPFLAGARIDLTVLLFTFGISVFSSVLFGLVPALQYSKADLQETLKEGRHSSGWGVRSRRIFNGLVVVEVALALVLLIGGGLLIKSLSRLLSVEFGYNPTNVLTMQISLPQNRYRTSQQMESFFDELLKKVGTLPGVQQVGATQSIPLGSGEKYYMYMDVQGRPGPPTSEGRPPIGFFQVTPGYFGAMGTPILKGRTFTEQDGRQSQQVVVISESAAKFFFPNEDPIGQSIALGSPGGWGPWLQVIGVVPEMRFEDLNRQPAYQVYANYFQGTEIGTLPSLVLAVRTSSPPMNLAAAIRGQVASMDNQQPVAKVATMEELVADSLAQRRFVTTIFGAFAGIALALAAVGIASVMSYTVTQRKHEIGVRMALGAQSRNVLKLVVGQGMLLAVGGLAGGLLAAYGMSRLLANLLFEIKPGDPLTYLASSAVLGVVAFLSCYIPALRATRVDPSIALRSE